MWARAGIAAPDDAAQNGKRAGAMAIDDSPSSFFAPWPDRLRHSGIVLLTAALALAVLVAFGELPLVRAAAVFACIAAAALVPLRLHHVTASREDVRGVNPVETAAVSAIVRYQIAFSQGFKMISGA